MTEAEWPTEDDPESMIESLTKKRRAHPPKSRLYGGAISAGSPPGLLLHTGLLAPDRPANLSGA